MNNKISLKHIAEKLNISFGTVSLTLNGRGNEMRISEETQKLIINTAKEMGYPLERVRKKKQTVGVNDKPVVVIFLPVLTGDVISPYDRIMNGLNHSIQENNIQVEIIVCPFEYGKLNRKYRYMSSAFCTGAIVFSMSETDLDELTEQEFDIPLVVFNRINERYSTVHVDDYSIGYNVAKIFNKKGCKHASIFTPDYKNKPMLLRKMGFEAGCSDYNIEIDDMCNVICRVEDETVEKHIGSICENNKLPDMIFANIDDMGLSIIKAMRKRNVDIPEDVELISYGGNAWTKDITPSISSICLNIEAMSGECIMLLWKMIVSGDWSPIAKVYPIETIYRESMKE